jgi:ABC-2 type transport system permease protein
MMTAMRAELFKLRTTRTATYLLGAMIASAVFVVLLHGLLLPAGNIDSRSDQLTIVLSWGELLGVLYAALLGAMSFTSEIRHGTIRPTLLITPHRSRVIIAKVFASMLVGAGFGFVAGVAAAGAGVGALSSRGIGLRVDASDFALLIAGGAAAAGLWAAIGVGVGTVVGTQAPTLVSLCAWLLFVENLLVGDLRIVGDLGRLLPGAAGKAITGQNPDTLLAPGLGLFLLVAHATVTAVAGCCAFARRDID